MRTKKSSDPLLLIDAVPGLPQKIWSNLPRYDPSTWELPTNPTPLINLAGASEVNRIYGLTCQAEQNIQLRNLLHGPLRDRRKSTRVDAMSWIIGQWGGINRGLDKLDNWADDLKTYRDYEVKDFLTKNKMNRVSSWSKVLAFADSNKYAIYDSRVAMTLNGILDDLGYDTVRFYMPPPQIEKLKKLFKHVKLHIKDVYKGRRRRYAGYTEYMQLLNKMVALGLAKDVLEIEMRMFSQGPNWARIYATKYKL